MWLASCRTLILRGLVTIAFGLLLMLWPRVGLDVFVLLFGAFAVVEGALILTAAALAVRGVPGRTLAVVAGLLSVIVGTFTFLWPGLTQLALLILIAVRAIGVGVAELATAVHIGQHAPRMGAATLLVASAGLLSIAFGTVLLLLPEIGLIAVVWALGLYTIVLGFGVIAKAWLFTLPSHALMTAQR